MCRTVYNKVSWVLVLTVLIFFAGCQEKERVETNRVLLRTTLGEIELELFPDKAPISVENFLSYVRSGFYKNVLFHRVVTDFVIQGGGYDKNYTKKETQTPIKNEANNGLSNLRGTVAWARTSDVHSATSQFFINLRDNTRLDYRDSTAAGYGYAVFGKVIRGMDVVDKIGSVFIGAHHGMRDIPMKPVVIRSAKIVMEEKKS